MGLLWSVEDADRRHRRPRREKVGLALVTGVCVALGTLLPRSPTVAQVESAPSVLRASLERGELQRVRCDELEARMDGERWRGLDRARRQGVVLALAWTCYGRRGVDAITLVDSKTGVVLATSARGDTRLVD